MRQHKRDKFKLNLKRVIAMTLASVLMLGTLPAMASEPEIVEKNLEERDMFAKNVITLDKNKIYKWASYYIKLGEDIEVENHLVGNEGLPNSYKTWTMGNLGVSVNYLNRVNSDGEYTYTYGTDSVRPVRGWTETLGKNSENILEYSCNNQLQDNEEFTVVIMKKEGNYKDRPLRVITRVHYFGHNIGDLAPEVVTIEPEDTKEINVGESKTLTAKVYPIDAIKKEISWESSNPEVISVDSSGNIKGIKKGIADIYAVTHFGVKGTQRIECKVPAPIPVKDVIIEPIDGGILDIGKTVKLNVKVEPANATNDKFIYASSIPAYVSVNDTGEITAHRKGKSTITVWDASGKIGKKIVVEGWKPIEKIVINDDLPKYLKKDMELSLKCTTLPVDASPESIIFRTSDSKLAKVVGGRLVINGSKIPSELGITAMGSKHPEVKAEYEKKIVYTEPNIIRIERHKIPYYLSKAKVGDLGYQPDANKYTFNKDAMQYFPEDSSDFELMGTKASEDKFVKVEGSEFSDPTFLIKEKGYSNVELNFRLKDDNNITFSKKFEIKVVDSVEGLKIKNPKNNMEIGSDHTLQTEITPLNAECKDVVYTSTDTKVASVDDTGKVLAKAGGNTRIRATTAQDSNYRLSDEYNLFVGEKPVSVNIKNKVSRMEVDAQHKLEVEVLPTGSTVSGYIYESSSPEFATVSGEGTITANKVGNTKITVKNKDDMTMLDSFELEVHRAPTSVEITNKVNTLANSTDYQLKWLVSPEDTSNKNVTFTSSNPEVAEVGSNGSVHPKSKGSTTLKIITEEGSKEDSFLVNILEKTSGVKILNKISSMPENSNYQLTWQVLPEDADNKNVVFNSDNISVATISETGKITTKSKGVFRITVTTEDGNFVDSFICGVKKDVTSVEITNKIPKLETQNNYQLEWVVNPADADNKEVDFISSDESVAKITEGGKIETNSAGVVTIKVVTRNKQKEDSFSLEVIPKVGSVQITNKINTINIHNKHQLEWVVLPDKAANKNVSFVSSDTKVLEVSDTGEIIPKKDGTALVKVTTEDGKFEDSFSLLVTTPLESVTILNTEKKLLVGENLQILLAISPDYLKGEEFEYTTSDSKVLNIDEGGKVLATGKGTATIYVKSKSNKLLGDSIELVVGKKPKSINIKNKDYTIYEKQEQQIDWEFLPLDADAEKVKFTSSDKTIATVSETGLLTGVNKGLCTVRIESEDGVLASECNIIVMKKVEGIRITNKKTTIMKNTKYQVDVESTPVGSVLDGVIYKSSDIKVAKIDTNGLIETIKSGDCRIIATTADGKFSDYFDLEVISPVEKIEITNKIAMISNKNKYQLEWLISPDDAKNKEVEFTSSEDGVVSVSTSGLLSPNKSGTSTIKVTTKDGKHYDSFKIIVTEDVESIEIKNKIKELKVSDRHQIVWEVKPDSADNKNVIFKTSNPAVAQITGTGKVSAIGVGVCEISIETEDGRLKDFFSLRVIKPAESLNILNKIKELYVGNNHKLLWEVKPDDAENKEVTLKSSDTTVATIESTGEIRAIKNGKVTISVETLDKKLSDSFELNILQSTGSVSIKNKITTIDVGKKHDLDWEVLPVNASNKNVIFSTTPVGIVEVSESGVLNAIKAGTASVTVTTEDGKYTDSFSIEVENVAKSITILNKIKSMREKSSYQIQWEIKPDDTSNKDVVFSTSNDKVVAVNNSGELQTLKAGTAIILVKTIKGNLVDSFEMEVTNSIDSLDVVEEDIEMFVGEKRTITVNKTPLDSKDTIVYKSEKEQIVKVSEAGEIEAMATGVTYITAYSVENNGISDKVKVTVRERLIDITVPKDKIVLFVGESKEVQIKLNPTNSDVEDLTYIVLDNSVSSFDTKSSKITGLKIGETKLVIESKKYNIKKEVDVEVYQLAKSIKFDKDEYNIMEDDFNTYLTYTIKPKNTKNKDVVFKVKDKSILSLDSSGKVTPIKVGSTDVVVETVEGSLKDKVQVNILPVASEPCNIADNLPIDTVTGLPMLIMKVKTTKAFKKDPKHIVKLSTDSFISVDNNIITAKEVGDTILFVGTTDETVGTKVLVRVIYEPTSIEINRKTIDVGTIEPVKTVIKLYPDDHKAEDITIKVGDTKYIKIINTTKGVDCMVKDGELKYSDVIKDKVTFEVLGKEKGTTEITISVGGVDVKIPVKVTEITTKMYLNRDFNRMKVGETFNLDAYFEPELKSANVVWSSLDSSICTVDSTGNVVGTGIGKTVITARETTKGLECVCEVNVKDNDKPNRDDTTKPDRKPEEKKTEEKKPEEKKTEEKKPEEKKKEKEAGGKDKEKEAGGKDKEGKTLSMSKGMSINQITKDKGYMVGYPDKEFKAVNNMTREEFAAILDRLLVIDNVSTTGTETFKDLDNSWCSESILRLSKAGIIFGVGGNKFKPKDSITREQAVIMVTRSLDLSIYPDVCTLRDIDKSESKQMIAKAFNAGIISGDKDGNFRGDEYISRAEVVTIVNNMIYANKEVDKENKFKDINSENWYYTDVLKATK